MLPDETSTRQTAGALAAAGVDGCFYWYDNNWHYLRQWHHLKKMTAAAKLPAQIFDHCPDYGQIELPRSDAIMGRTISMQIKLGWSEAELQQRIEKMNGVFGR
jgi:8-amino-3,8-dideoxy-alpha-D-manno-octulosonate transaminase